MIEDPTRCKFDPKVFECKGDDAPSCLTAPQVEVARKIYAGPGFFPGLEPGSEIGWATLSGPKPMDLAVEVYKYLVFQDPKWDYLTLNPEADIARADKTIGSRMNSVDPNLKPLFAHGAKLLQYHGWADPGIPPGSSVNYYKSVLEAMGGKAKVDNSYRLFMVPGMGHCGGGDGTSTFDMVSALDAMGQQGKAPDRIVASQGGEWRGGANAPVVPLSAGRDLQRNGEHGRCHATSPVRRQSKHLRRHARLMCLFLLAVSHMRKPYPATRWSKP